MADMDKSAMKASEWVRRVMLAKAPETPPKRTRVARAVVRRANSNPHPWDAPVYRGEFDYDVKAPRID